MTIGEIKVGSQDVYGSTIKEVLFSSDTVAVYFNSKEQISWYQVSCDLPEDFGEVQNNVAEWESKINKLFKSDGLTHKRVLAEALVRILENKNIVQARYIIDRVSKIVDKRGNELLKQYYAISSFVVTVITCCLIWSSKYHKVYIEPNYGKAEYEIWMTMLFGGIGAFIFTIISLKNYKADIDISKNVHILDGALRIFYGVIFALVIAIAVKSNLLLGFLNQTEKSIYVTVFLGICAGASEMLIPSLIKQIETKADPE